MIMSVFRWSEIALPISRPAEILRRYPVLRLKTRLYGWAALGLLGSTVHHLNTYPTFCNFLSISIINRLAFSLSILTEVLTG